MSHFFFFSHLLQVAYENVIYSHMQSGLKTPFSEMFFPKMHKEMKETKCCPNMQSACKSTLSMLLFEEKFITCCPHAILPKKLTMQSFRESSPFSYSHLKKK
eukprot:GDKK01025396.1.p1 GENE.GDKK01025396.1~~GDKK01025396.1.p1  ORF type:complete len:119 (+),score=11.10 GDKK01025396.1:52-357(+)